MFDVRDFGAKGDGKLDDGPAIQAAIDAAATSVVAGTNATVLIPAGTYIIGTPNQPPDIPAEERNRPLVIPSNIRLIGEGIGQTTLKLPDNASQVAPWGSQFVVPPDDDPTIDPDMGYHLATLLINKGHKWWFGDGSDNFEVTNNIEIAYMTLDANNIGQQIIYNIDTGASKSRGGLISAACALSQVSNAYLHDLELRNSADIGLLLQSGSNTVESGITNSLFERLWIHHSGWVGLTINGDSSDLYFINCLMEKNQKAGAAITPV